MPAMQRQRPPDSAAVARMTTLTVVPHAQLCPAGCRIDVAAGTSIAETLLEHDIPI